MLSYSIVQSPTYGAEKQFKQCRFGRLPPGDPMAMLTCLTSLAARSRTRQMPPPLSGHAAFGLSVCGVTMRQ